MLTAFVCTDGHLQRVEQPDSADSLADAVWIDLLQPDDAETTMVRRVTGLTVPSEADVSEIETSSRLATRDGVLYLSLPLVSLSRGGPRGVSAGFVLSQQRLLTVRFAPNHAFDAFAEALPNAAPGNKTGAHILIGLLEALVDRQADALETIRSDLETLSHTIFEMGTTESKGRRYEDKALRRILGELGRIGDLTSHIRDSQVGASRIVPYIQGMTKDWMPKDLTVRLSTLRKDIASLSEFDEHLNTKLQFLLDATLGFINIAQNGVMKVMAIASVVGIPPVLVAGVYGMNFEIMPELKWQWGYGFGLAMIALSAVIPAAIFRWRKWI
jgi:magnesium transporter